MKVNILLMIFQAVVIKSLANSYHNDNGCQFRYDASSLEDDSDYQFDGSGTDAYDIGDDLRLKVHVNNDWELRVSWNTSKYEAQAPEGGWNFKVQITVNTTYQTSFGQKSFTSSSEKTTHKNHETFPLYNPSATYTVTLLAATRTKQCLGERVVVNDLPGREDAIAHFQIKLRFYTYWPCARKLHKSQDKILSRFNSEIFDALSKENFQSRHGILLNVSQYQLTDLTVACQDGDDRIAIFTGRVVAMGNTSNTQFIRAMQSWVRTQPILPIRQDSVVVDRNCPVYFVPATGEFCTEPDVQSTDTPENKETDTSDNDNNTVTVVIIVVVVILTIILLGLSLLVCGASRKKIFSRVNNFSFRSQASVSRRLRINNVLADIESIDSRSPENASSELPDSSSHQQSKGT